MPATQIFWGKRNFSNADAQFQVSITKEYFQKCLGTHSDRKHINSRIREWYYDMLMELCGASKKEKGDWTEEDFKKAETFNYFTLSKVKGEDIVFTITKPNEVTNLHSQKRFIKFSTMGIMENENTHMLPLYISLSIDGSVCGKNGKEGSLAYSTKNLKYTFGYTDPFDYCTVPAKVNQTAKEFVEEYIEFCTEYELSEEDIANGLELNQVKKINLKCLGHKYNIPEDKVTKIYNKVLKKVHFKRFEFEHNILIPALEAINQSGMMKINTQRNRKKTPKGAERQNEYKLFFKKHQTLIKYQKSEYVDYGRVCCYIINFERLL